MNQEEKRDLLEVAMQAVGQVLNDQQNRIFHNGALRPDRFPSNAYPNWVQWKSHFTAVAAANRWTQIQAINALPVCLNGHALDEFHAAPAALKEPAEGEPAPTLQNLFEHLDRALGVLRNDRMGRSEFKALVQKEGESLRDFARRVRSVGTQVFANLNAEQRDEQFRERFIEGLFDPELLEVLLREDSRSFTDTINRAVDLETITRSIRNRSTKRVAALRVTQEATTGSSNPEMTEMRQQMNEVSQAMNNLTNMMSRFMSSVLPMPYPQAATTPAQEKKLFNPNEGTNRYGNNFNNQGGSGNKPHSSRQTLACYECGEEGHFARACPKKSEALNSEGPGSQ